MTVLPMCLQRGVKMGRYKTATTVTSVWEMPMRTRRLGPLRNSYPVATVEDLVCFLLATLWNTILLALLWIYCRAFPKAGCVYFHCCLGLGAIFCLQVNLNMCTVITYYLQEIYFTTGSESSPSWTLNLANNM